MKVILIRHFRVSLDWKFFYTSKEYQAARDLYNTSPVIDFPFVTEPTGKIWTSTYTRAMDTSRKIFSREPDHCEKGLCEVPLKPFMNSSFPLPKFIWDTIGRIQWWLNLPGQPESYHQSRKRASRMVDLLVRDNEDVTMVGHGWMIKLMMRELRKRGFKGPSPFHIRNGVPYVFIKS